MGLAGIYCLYWIGSGLYDFGGPLAWLSGRYALLAGLDSIDDLHNWLSSSVDLGWLS